MSAPEAIETERLLLRPLSYRDAEDVFAYASRPETSRYLSWPPHTSITDSEIFIATVLTAYAKEAPPLWAAVLKEEDRVIGTISFLTHNHIHGYADIGYVLTPEAWGQGLATEATCAILDYGFTEMGLNRIEAQVRTSNKASARVLEKAGFQREALLAQRFFIEGTHHDSYLYALLRRDWMRA